MKRLVSLAALALAACTGTPPGNDTPTASAQTDAAGALAIFPALDAAAGKAQNIVYSPASVEQAFGLLQLGAAGATLAQLERVLPLTQPYEKLGFKNNQVEVRVANALFLSDQWRFQGRFVEQARQRFSATTDRVNFADKPSTKALVNGWAAKATDGLVPAVVEDSSFDQDTVALLANAIYFDGKWRTYFNGREKQPFLFGDGSEREFLLLQQVLEARTAERGKWRAVRLPYSGERFVMDVIMPDRRAVMALTPSIAEIAALSAALAAEQPRSVDMRLPQFEVDYQTGLIPALRAAGLTLPFDRDRADLSRMVDAGQPRIHVDAVQHVTKLQVSGEGTRAAAVTTLRIVPVSAQRHITPPVPFTVDRPFVFIIRDLETGAILFLGRIAAPQVFEPEVKNPLDEAS